MRDPVIYRVARMTHHNTGDAWCIYPMYDFAHPIEDAIEHITHSICTLEFEDHRPLYDWVVRECEFENPPRQIEFAKLYLTNVITGKRYIKKLVEDGIVDGWDDPRLVSIAALRRRGYTPEAIRKFVDLVGVSKSSTTIRKARPSCWRFRTTWRIQSLDPVWFRLAESFTLSARISWRSRRANTSVCSRATRFVL